MNKQDFEMPKQCLACRSELIPKQIFELDMVNRCTLCLYNTQTVVTNNFRAKPKGPNKRRA